MKKVVKDTKSLLFENMLKLNPDFKLKQGMLNENQDNWIQNVVDPEHKDYCTPLSKPTCTPKRKALAMRFKKGIKNEGFDMSQFSQNPEEYQEKAKKIKQTIDNLFLNNDYDIIDNMYKLFVGRKSEQNKLNTSNITEHHSPEYGKKAELIKGKIDFLFDNDHYDIIDKVNEIINKLFPDDESDMELDESKK